MSALARRLTAQLLAGEPARDAPAVAERLLAIQAQDPRGARLAIRVRSRDVSAADVDRELTERRSLLITWLNRGTLHLVRTEDYPLLQSLTAPPVLNGVARRLAQDGVAPDVAARGVAEIERLLGEEGPMARVELRASLRRAGVPVAGQAFVHLLVRASLEGRIVRGPMAGAEHAFVRVADWIGTTRPPARELAMAELARRYLAGHGPAGERDLARWAGIGLRDARAALQAISGRLRSRPDGLVELASPPAHTARMPPPRLLGSFEPLLMGWRSRADVLGEGEARVVSGGIFRGFAIVGGRAAAVWRFAGPGVAIEPFRALSTSQAAALDRDAAALIRFLGPTLTTPR